MLFAVQGVQLGHVVGADCVGDATVVGELGIADDLAASVVGDGEDGVVRKGLVGGVVAAKLSRVHAGVANDDEDLVVIEAGRENRFGFDSSEPLRPVGEAAGQRGLVEVLS